MTRNKVPIGEAPIRGAKATGIQYSMEFAEYEACVAAHLNLHDWVMDGYPLWFKARVVAWHGLHHQVEMHKQDAVRPKKK